MPFPGQFYLTANYHSISRATCERNKQAKSRGLSGGPVAKTNWLGYYIPYATTNGSFAKLEISSAITKIWCSQIHWKKIFFKEKLTQKL